jgi:hypothetical protein
MNKNHAVVQARALLDSIYDRSVVGCCLHVVVDDGNIEDHNIWFVLRVAVEAGHADCIHLAWWLNSLSRDERDRFVNGRPPTAKTYEYPHGEAKRLVDEGAVVIESMTITEIKE